MDNKIATQEALMTSAVKVLDNATTKKTLMEKLSSRKFWISLAGCIVGILGMIGMNDNTVAIIAFAIIEVGSILGYCWAEGKVDAVHAQELLTVVSKIIDMIKAENEKKIPENTTPDAPTADPGTSTSATVDPAITDISK